MKKLTLAAVASIALSGCAANEMDVAESPLVELASLEDGQTIVRGNVVERVYTAEISQREYSNDVIVTKESADTVTIGQVIIQNPDGSCFSRTVTMEAIDELSLGGTDSSAPNTIELPKLRSQTKSVSCDTPLSS